MIELKQDIGLALKSRGFPKAKLDSETHNKGNVKSPSNKLKIIYEHV
jgi:hypothetical protein